MGTIINRTFMRILPDGSGYKDVKEYVEDFGYNIENICSSGEYTYVYLVKRVEN